MPDVTQVLSAFREELIAAGIARRAAEPGPAAGAPYPMLIEPAAGAPAPGELSAEDNDHTELVLSLFHDGDVAPGTNYDARTRRVTVLNIAYRAAGALGLQKAMAADAAIVTRLIRPETNYGYGFMLGTDAAVFAHQAGVFAGFGPVARLPGPGGGLFHQAAKYLVETAR